MKIGRNDPCHCGSQKKYKKCCFARDEAARAAELPDAGTAKLATAGNSRAGRHADKSPGAVGAPRPKGPPPKSPTQIRRRAI